jgi:hypothetical protein
MIIAMLAMTVVSAETGDSQDHGRNRLVGRFKQASGNGASP